MVSVAGDQDVSDGRLGRHAALDQAGRRGFLQDHAGAGPAGQLRPLRHDDAEPRGDHVQPLRGVDADLDQRALAAGAGLGLGRQHHLDPRQVRGQSAAAGPAALGLALLQGRGGLARPGRVAGQRRLDLLEREQQLLLRQPLRLRPELPALQLQQQVLQPLILTRQRIALSNQVVDLHQGLEQQRGVFWQARRAVHRGAHRATESTLARSA